MEGSQLSSTDEFVSRVMRVAYSGTAAAIITMIAVAGALKCEATKGDEAVNVIMKCITTAHQAGKNLDLTLAIHILDQYDELE